MPFNVLKELSILSDVTDKYTQESKEENLRLQEWFELCKQKAVDISNGSSENAINIPNCLAFLRGNEIKKLPSRVSKVLYLQGKDRLHRKDSNSRRSQRQTRTLDVKQNLNLQLNSVTPTEQSFKSESSSVENTHTPCKKIKLNKTFRKSIENLTPLQEDVPGKRQTSGRLRSSKRTPELSSTSSTLNSETSTTSSSGKENKILNGEVESINPKTTVVPELLKIEKKRKREEKVEKAKETTEKYVKKQKVSHESTGEKSSEDVEQGIELPKSAKNDNDVLKDLEKKTELPKTTDKKATRTRNKINKNENARQPRTRHDAKPKSSSKKIEKLPKSSRKSGESKKAQINTKLQQSEQDSATKTKARVTRAAATRNIIKKTNKKEGVDLNTTFISTAEKVTTKADATADSKKCNSKMALQVDLPSTPKMSEKIYSKDKKPPTPAILKQATKLTSLVHSDSKTPVKPPRGTNTVVKQPLVSASILAKQPGASTSAVAKQPGASTSAVAKQPGASASALSKQPSASASAVVKQPITGNGTITKQLPSGTKQPATGTSIARQAPIGTSVSKQLPTCLSAAAKHPININAVTKQHPNSKSTLTKLPTGKTTLSKQLPTSTSTPAKQPVLKQSYELTPEQTSFVSYDISEIRDSDEEEEEDKGKPIPAWAKGVRLRNALLHQHYHPMDTDELFGEVLPVDLEGIFGVKKVKYTKRTSSAVWNSPSSFTKGT